MHASSACTNPNLNEVFLRLQTAQGVEHHPLNKSDTHTQTPCASACPLSCLRTSCLDTYDIKVLAASTYMHKSKSAGMQILGRCTDPRFLLPECGTVHISYSASHDPQQPFTLYSQPPGDCDGQVLVSGLGLVTYGRLRWSGLGFRSWPSDLVPVWPRRQKNLTDLRFEVYVCAGRPEDMNHKQAQCLESLSELYWNTSSLSRSNPSDNDAERQPRIQQQQQQQQQQQTAQTPRLAAAAAAAAAVTT